MHLEYHAIFEKIDKYHYNLRYWVYFFRGVLLLFLFVCVVVLVVVVLFATCTETLFSMKKTNLVNKIYS